MSTDVPTSAARLDTARAVVLPGPGAVVRLPGLLGLLRLDVGEDTDAPAAEGHLARLVEICTEISGGAPTAPGRPLARRLARWLGSLDPGPDLGIVSATEDGVALFLHGAVDAVLGRDLYSAADSGAWLDRLLPHPGGPIVLLPTGRSAPEHHQRAVFDLRGGVVPAGAVMLMPRSGPVPAALVQPGSSVVAPGLRSGPVPRDLPPPESDAERPVRPEGEPTEQPGPAAEKPEPVAEQPPPAAEQPAPAAETPAPAAVRPAPAAEQPAPAAETPVPAAVRPAPAAEKPAPAADQPAPAAAAPAADQPAPPAAAPAAEQPVPTDPSPFAPVLTPAAARPQPPLDLGSATIIGVPPPGSQPHPDPRPAPRRVAPILGVGPEEPPRAPLEAGEARTAARGPRPHADPVPATAVLGAPDRGPARPGTRPPLGVLVFDDGSRHLIDADYLLGRMPQADPRVQRGQLRALPVDDPEAQLSRGHLVLKLEGWDVCAIDESRNGTLVAWPSEQSWSRLTPRLPSRLVPGTRVRVGGRTFVFEAPSEPR